MIIFSYILLLTFLRRSAYLTFLDHVLQEMKSRFSGVYRNATMGLYILPNNVNNLTAEMTDTIMSFHSRDLPAAATFLQEIKLWQNLWRTADEKPTSIEDTLNHPRVSSMTFPNIVSILNLMLLLPVTSAGVERANSALKFIKTDRRNRMQESRLNALLLLFMHKDIEINIDKVIDIFSRKKARRMLMTNPVAN